MDITGVSVNKSNSKGWLENLLNSPAPAPSGCVEPGAESSDDRGVADESTNGEAVPMNPPNVRQASGQTPSPNNLPTVTGTGGTSITTGSGAVIYGDDSDGVVILPTREGQSGEELPVLPDDIYFRIEGQGSEFLTTPLIFLDSGVIRGENVSSLHLFLELGTDSTEIEGMPDSGCFSELVNVERLSDEAAALSQEERETYGISTCPQEGYEEFLICPEGNGIPLYLAGYTVEGYRLVGGNYELIGTESVTLTDVEALFLNPSSG